MEIKEKITSFVKNPTEFFSSVVEEPLSATVKHLGVLVIAMMIINYLLVMRTTFISFMDIISSFITIFFIAPLIMHLLLRVLKGTAGIKGTLTAYWYVLVYIGVISLPFLVIQTLLPHFIILLITNLAFVAIFIWMAVLLVIGLKVVHELSAVKVIISLVLFAVIAFIVRFITIIVLTTNK